MERLRDLPGQEDFVRRAERWLQLREGQSLLLVGERAQGTEEAARSIAAALLCQDVQQAGSEACGRCPSCRSFAARSHPDYVDLLLPAGQKQIRVEQLRQDFLAATNLAPQMGAVKVFVLDLDGLTEAAQNLLLKTLEEPLPGMYFICLSSREEGVLETIRSRLIRWALAPLSPEAMRQRYAAEGWGAEWGDFYHYFSDGSWARAEALRQDEDFAQLRAFVLAELEALPRLSLGSWLSEHYADWLSYEGQFELLLGLLRYCFLQLLLLRGGGGQAVSGPTDFSPALEALAPVLSTESLSAVLEDLRRIQERRQVNSNAKIALASILLRLYEETHTCLE